MRLAFWIEDVDGSPQPEKKPARRRPCRRRHVRFDLLQNQYHEKNTRPAQHDSDDETSDLWYHPNDYAAFQQQAQTAAEAAPNEAWFRASVCLYFSLRTEDTRLSIVAGHGNAPLGGRNGRIGHLLCHLSRSS